MTLQTGLEKATEGAEVACLCRLFQIQAAATGKARSLTVDSRVRLTISDEDKAERMVYNAIYTVGHKNVPFYFCPYLSQSLTNF